MRSAAKVVFIAAMIAAASAHPVYGQYSRPVLTVGGPEVAREASTANSGTIPHPQASSNATKKGRNILVGAGIGAGVGAIIGAISIHNHPPGDYSLGTGGTVIGLGLLGAIAGALVGWMVSASVRS